MPQAVALRLPESLQALVDCRLDTIDRMLMGRVARQDRVSIVREVEAQVFELLLERDTEDLTREDVLAVLGRLDPPEAYLPESNGGERATPRMSSRLPEPLLTHKGNPRVAKYGGILGLVSLTLALLGPVVGHAIAIPFQSIEVLCIVWGISSLLTFVSGILGFVLALNSRMGSPWAIVGIVTSSISVLCTLALPLVILFRS